MTMAKVKPAKLVKPKMYFLTEFGFKEVPEIKGDVRAWSKSMQEKLKRMHRAIKNGKKKTD